MSSEVLCFKGLVSTHGCWFQHIDEANGESTGYQFDQEISGRLAGRCTTGMVLLDSCLCRLDMMGTSENLVPSPLVFIGASLCLLKLRSEPSTPIPNFNIY